MLSVEVTIRKDTGLGTLSTIPKLAVIVWSSVAVYMFFAADVITRPSTIITISGLNGSLQLTDWDTSRLVSRRHILSGLLYHRL